MSEAEEQGRQSDLAVMDAQEYKQKRRLRRILDAHDKVEEMSELAYGEFAQGAIGEDGKNIRVLRAVQEYIRECYNLLTEFSNELREEGDGRVNSYWTGGGNPLGQIEFVQREPIQFWGLRDVLEAELIYHEEWTETVEARHGPATTVTKEETYTVPERVSMNAFLLLNRFLAEEKDLEIQFEAMKDKLPGWGFEKVQPEDVESEQMEVL